MAGCIGGESIKDLGLSIIHITTKGQPRPSLHISRKVKHKQGRIDGVDFGRGESREGKTLLAFQQKIGPIIGAEINASSNVTSCDDAYRFTFTVVRQNQTLTADAVVQ